MLKKLRLYFSYFRDINVNYKTNLIEVKTDTKEAIFEKLETGEKQTFKVKYIDGFDSARFPF